MINTSFVMVFLSEVCELQPPFWPSEFSQDLHYNLHQQFFDACECRCLHGGGHFPAAMPSTATAQSTEQLKASNPRRIQWQILPTAYFAGRSRISARACIRFPSTALLAVRALSFSERERLWSLGSPLVSLELSAV